ncbi:hypothetical protein LEMLEM_LOCUS1848 [Lemmus lemmus]
MCFFSSKPSEESLPSDQCDTSQTELSPEENSLNTENIHPVEKERMTIQNEFVTCNKPVCCMGLQNGMETAQREHMSLKMTRFGKEKEQQEPHQQKRKCGRQHKSPNILVFGLLEEERKKRDRMM